ncbi:hypothetical protein ALIPUT_01388 [Alistipes putredinis DSM 17216]|uniref:Uncharacterized protein n=1 Tax=Alistipes putredinis DSM 17216 TaxID=445970 RepID=B0MW86_9BACT|nr:hypothetical protein ALIPUT_01388 [Alistipes putredinis DSM 17216]
MFFVLKTFPVKERRSEGKAVGVGSFRRENLSDDTENTSIFSHIIKRI